MMYFSKSSSWANAIGKERSDCYQKDVYPAKGVQVKKSQQLFGDCMDRL